MLDSKYQSSQYSTNSDIHTFSLLVGACLASLIVGWSYFDDPAILRLPVFGSINRLNDHKQKHASLVRRYHHEETLLKFSLEIPDDVQVIPAPLVIPFQLSDLIRHRSAFPSPSSRLPS